ncbi:hydroxylamine reductase [Aphanomyces astaci]|uniref:Hydroxylamine reductase n=1 Tax=Aphanomyces astaci TaxID=112090 RepID=W4FPR7_APHAT|nr:hydroxylamine reductase [Aphanomyces astaci]ETV68819.1 hydroxylamine reductase [Aphanomyces astaci]|eukprot:XP_009841773.1 hydroxylamine reductase [Aphanomyces astaci]
MLILYGSQTGTTESFAKIVHSFATARGLSPRLVAADDFDHADLVHEDVIVFLTSTFYNGEFPSNFTRTWDYLQTTTAKFTTTKFAVFGLGNSATKSNFNNAGKQLDAQLEALGGERLVPLGLGDEQADSGHETSFRPWVQSLWVKLLGGHGKMTLPVQYGISYPTKDVESAPRTIPGFDAFRVVSNTLLTPVGYERPSYLLTLELPPRVTYELGDHIQVAHVNSDDLVLRLARRMHLDLSTTVHLSALANSTGLPTDPVKLQVLLRDHLDLSSPPSRSFLEGLSALCTDKKEATELEHLAEDMTAGNAYSQYVGTNPASRIPFTLVDVLELYPSIQVGLEHILGNVPILPPRYYSVCSSPLMLPRHVQIVYMVAKWQSSKSPLKTFTGAAAGYMSHLKTDALVTAQISRGYFKVPESLETPILGVALGTGISFFRALLQHRAYHQDHNAIVSKIRLYFGIRHASKDFLFQNELDTYVNRGLLELAPACSHDGASFVTPVTLIRDFPTSVAEYLDNQGVYFYCGIGGTIPEFHEAAIEAALQASHKSTLGSEMETVDEMKASGRWQIEAFSSCLDHENALQYQQKVQSKKEDTPISDVVGDCAMFCFQCGQTNQGIGCTKIGVCGKTPTVAALQDLLVDHLKHLSWYAHHIRVVDPDVTSLTEVDRFSLVALFSTLTNVNFDATRFVTFIQQTKAFTDTLSQEYATVCKAHGVTPRAVPWKRTDANVVDIEELVASGKKVGVLSRLRAGRNDALVGLQEMLVYGLKGLAAYTDHSFQFGNEKPEIYHFIHEAFAFLWSPEAGKVDKVVDMLMKCGQVNLTALALLHESNNTYGAQSPGIATSVPRPGKCILVSGHDLKMLHDVLEACASYKTDHGVHINVYTHGELLPAHGYPALRASPHLIGHFGAAWQRQSLEFAHFPGSILMTTNCLTQPKTEYKDRLFTAGAVGWQDIPHLEDGQYAPLLAKAVAGVGFTDADLKFNYPANPFVNTVEKYHVGWGSETVIGAAATVLQAVTDGHISRFYVIGGCDGYEGERSYYTDLAKALPDTSVVLTVGCGKFRINHLDMGTIGDTGIPRLLDLGQCNDSYSAVQIALALAQALQCGVNDLPLSIVLSWFEQKAVVVLLTLLSLGIRNIRVGPTVPAFLRPSIFKVLHEKFNLMAIGADVHQDIANMVGGDKTPTA